MILGTTVEKKDEGILEVKCKVESGYIEKILGEVARDIQRKANLKGFRKGKAPLNMIKKIYEGQIRYEALNKILPEVFEKVSKEQDIKAITTPEFSGYESITEGQDLELSFVVETIPQVEEMMDPTEVEVEKVEFEYDPQEMVEKEIQMIRKTQAKHKEIEEAVQEGDFVKAEYRFAPEGGEEQAPKTSYFIIRDKDPYYGLSKYFVGAKLKQEVRTEAEFAGDFGNPELAGKKGHLIFTVQEGKRVIYPEVNDEMAKKIGYGSLEALKESIRTNLKKKVKEQELLASADKVYRKIVEESTFSIAPSVVLQQSQSDMTQRVNQLIMQGKNIETYLSEEGLDQSGFIEKIKAESLYNIKKYLIVEKIFQDNDLKITEKEKEQAINELVELETVNREKIREYYEKNPQAKESLKERIKFRKVAELVLEKAKILGTEKKKLGEK